MIAPLSTMKYTAAQNAVIDFIVRQKLMEGDRLPNEIELSQYCSVSTITTRRALRELARLGVIERQQGRGTFVKQLPLNGHRLGTVVLLVVSAEPGLYMHMVGAAEGAILARGYGMRYIATSKPDDVTASEVAESTGILISGHVTREWVRFLEMTAKPFVILGTCDAEEPVWRVDYDWRSAVELLTRELLRRGCRTIGLLNAAHRYAPAREAYAAYTRILGEARIPVDENSVAWIKRGEFAQRVREFCEARADFPDGILVQQSIAPHLLAWFYGCGWQGRRPTLGVFADRPILNAAYESIIETQFSDDVTTRGVELLFDVMSRRNGPPAITLLKPALLPSESRGQVYGGKESPCSLPVFETS